MKELFFRILGWFNKPTDPKAGFKYVETVTSEEVTYEGEDIAVPEDLWSDDARL